MVRLRNMLTFNNLIKTQVFAKISIAQFNCVELFMLMNAMYSITPSYEHWWVPTLKKISNKET